LVNTSSAQLKQEQQFYDAGSVAKTQVLAVQAQYATDKYNLVTGQNIYRQNILTLKQLLLLPTATVFDISGPDSVQVQKLYPALQDAVSAALQTRPEIKSSLLSMQISELDLEKAKANGRPVVTASGTVSSGYSSQSGSFFQQMDNNFFQQIGLSLSVPIFTRRVTKTAVENSKIEIAQAQVNYENAKTVLSQQVEQAFINIENSESQYDAAVEQLNSAQEAYRIANEQLKVGAIDAVDLLVIKNQYIQALQAYIQAKYNTVLYVKIYDFYMGSPVTL
jgi:outer membrane protein